MVDDNRSNKMSKRVLPSARPARKPRMIDQWFVQFGDDFAVVVRSKNPISTADAVSALEMALASIPYLPRQSGPPETR